MQVLQENKLLELVIPSLLLHGICPPHLNNRSTTALLGKWQCYVVLHEGFG